MSRSSRLYGERAESAGLFEGLDPDAPRAGFYRFKLVHGGHPVGVRIWYGPPLDPHWRPEFETPRELDRAPRWQATANEAPIDLERVWPKCGREPIAEAEYRHLCSLQEWARRNAPDSPQANPNRRVDLLTAPIPDL